MAKYLLKPWIIVSLLFLSIIDHYSLAFTAISTRVRVNPKIFGAESYSGDDNNKNYKSKSLRKSVIDKSRILHRKDLISQVVEHVIDSLAAMDSTVGDVDDFDNEQFDRSRPDDTFDSVVRIYCTHSEPNFSIPWQRKRQEFSTSSGFMISGKQILTNAHAVEYGSLIQVKKRQCERKFVASVVAIGHECDLAVLRIEDEEVFWDNTTALEFGNLPELLEDVSVVGFPVGGDSISISSGVVSRIEMQEYAQASADLLAIQIDAAINPGNSGGPVLDSADQVIGVAFQSLHADDTENIGYVVPVNVIRHFLEDVTRNGMYSGVCSVGVRLQQLENEMLRQYLKMPSEATGVMVTQIAPLSPVAKLLQKRDVILSVDNIRIANDGTIPFREGAMKERVQLNYIFTLKFPGDTVELQILREGVQLTLVAPVEVHPKLVPRTLLQKNIVDVKSYTGTGSKGSIVGGNPSYLMVGGLVFVSLCHEYIQQAFNVEHMTAFDRWSDEFHILQLADSMPSIQGEEAVLLSQVITNDCNVGYEMLENKLLKSFNGERIMNLRHLKKLVDDAMLSANSHNSSSDQARLMIFEFASGLSVVLDRTRVVHAQEQICKEHFIPSSCSPDLTNIL